MSRVERLAVVGAGLMGASLGLAAKRAGAEVSGYDVDPDTLAEAVRRGAVDRPARSLSEAVARADLAVVAVPVAALPETVSAVLGESDASCTVTDVGSTKAGVCAAAGSSARFVGGHPVTGSEARGPAHATPELFDGASWFLTPTADTDAERYRLVHGFVRTLGATPVTVDPLAHDRLAALTSHLPHALANLLVNQAGATRIEGHDPLAAGGGSLRDMTRVAGANARVWVDIFLDNAEPLGEALTEHRRRLERVERALEQRDAGFLARWIGEAAGNRSRLLAQRFREPGQLHRVRVHVPDRPGILAGITQALSGARINIEDFELQHMSPERGGVLTLLVGGAEAAARAAELLEAQGYSALVAAELGEG